MAQPAHGRFRLASEVLRLTALAWLIALAAVSLAPRSFAAQSPAAPAITFQSGTITIANRQGGDVVLFGVLQEPHRYWATLFTEAERLQTDTEGAARYTPRSLPLYSVWIAVDFKSGSLAVAVPPGSPLQVRSLPAPELRRDPAGAISGLRSSRETIEVLVVRPNVGAWFVLNGDGGTNDDDKIVNGRTITAPEMMIPIGGSHAAPKRIVPHDVVVMVDPGTMAVYASEVAP